ncbi:UNVERIFIED_CONTAM: hypothetical protein RMT77_005219 [Armadillidium vulgare]
MDDIIRSNNLKGTFAYLDDVTICGASQEEHDENLQKFIEIAKSYNMTLNKDKCVFSRETVRLLGYEVTQNELRPDPTRLEPLRNMPVPTSKKSLSRMLGLFAYYSKWVQGFSHKIRPLIDSSFPLNEEAVTAINDLKGSIMKSVKLKIDESLPFTVETDASDTAIGATLNQDGRPVAFFSRTLSRYLFKVLEKKATGLPS